MEDGVAGAVDGVAEGAGLDEGRADNPLEGGAVDGAGEYPVRHVLHGVCYGAQGGHEVEVLGQ